MGNTVPQMGKRALPLEHWFWNPKSARVSRGTQWMGEADQTGKLRPGSFWDYVIANGRQFIFNSLSHWKPVQPVQFSKEWDDAWVHLKILKMSLAEQLLNLSMCFDELLGHSWQQRVTVVKTWQYQGCDEAFDSFNFEDMSNWANSIQLQVGRLTHMTNLLFHLELVLTCCFIESLSPNISLI